MEEINQKDFEFDLYTDQPIVKNLLQLHFDSNVMDNFNQDKIMDYLDQCINKNLLIHPLLLKIIFLKYPNEIIIKITEYLNSQIVDENSQLKQFIYQFINNLIMFEYDINQNMLIYDFLSQKISNLNFKQNINDDDYKKLSTLEIFQNEYEYIENINVKYKIYMRESEISLFDTTNKLNWNQMNAELAQLSEDLFFDKEYTANQIKYNFNNILDNIKSDLQFQLLKNQDFVLQASDYQQYCYNNKIEFKLIALSLENIYNFIGNISTLGKIFKLVDFINNIKKNKISEAYEVFRLTLNWSNQFLNIEIRLQVLLKDNLFKYKAGNRQKGFLKCCNSLKDIIYCFRIDELKNLSQNVSNTFNSYSNMIYVCANNLINILNLNTNDISCIKDSNVIQQFMNYLFIEENRDDSSIKQILNTIDHNQFNWIQDNGQYLKIDKIFPYDEGIQQITTIDNKMVIKEYNRILLEKNLQEIECKIEVLDIKHGLILGFSRSELQNIQLQSLEDQCQLNRIIKFEQGLNLRNHYKFHLIDSEKVCIVSQNKIMIQKQTEKDDSIEIKNKNGIMDFIVGKDMQLQPDEYVHTISLSKERDSKVFIQDKLIFYVYQNKLCIFNIDRIVQDFKFQKIKYFENKIQDYLVTECKINQNVSEFYFFVKFDVDSKWTLFKISILMNQELNCNKNDLNLQKIDNLDTSKNSIQSKISKNLSNSLKSLSFNIFNFN